MELHTGKHIFCVVDSHIKDFHFVMYSNENKTDCLVRDDWGRYHDVAVDHVFETSSEAYDYWEAEMNHSGKGELE